MDAVLKTIDLSSPTTKVEEYMGWTRSRHFLPTLKLYSLAQDLHINIVGYDKVWQFLDTICYKEPIPRQNFNTVLKHRADAAETSKEIIEGVIAESDLEAVTFHGVLSYTADKTFLDVDFTYSHFDEDIHPPLMEIASLFDSHSADGILFDNFEIQTRLKNNNYKKHTQVFPSVLMIRNYIETENYRPSSIVIRCVQFPNGNLGLFSNMFFSDQKYACSPPLQVSKMDDKLVIDWLSQCFYILEVCRGILRKDTWLKELPMWKQENTSGSTITHHQQNARMLLGTLKLKQKVI